MARKFSKNGKPLGRTSSKGNKHKAWTPEEDNFLRLAVEQKIPKSVVAGRLGRTKDSIVFRKYVLKIEGAFGRDVRSNAKKLETSNPVSQISQQTEAFSGQMQTVQTVQTFKLETGIPLPSRSGRTENLMAREKLRILLESMNVGQSFVVPRNLSHVTKHLVLKEFESYRIRICATNRDKKFYRIFRLA